MEQTIFTILENICEDSIVKENPDLNLFETGLMDSLGFTELLVDIEDQLGIIISPSEVSREEMDTPNKIIALLKARSH